MQVVKASIKWQGKGKPEFTAESQLHLDLTDQTGNFQYILAAVRDKWGNGYILVTNDGIEIEDSCTGTYYAVDADPGNLGGGQPRAAWTLFLTLITINALA